MFMKLCFYAPSFCCYNDNVTSSSAVHSTALCSNVMKMCCDGFSTRQNYWDLGHPGVLVIVGVTASGLIGFGFNSCYNKIFFSNWDGAAIIAGSVVLHTR